MTSIKINNIKGFSFMNIKEKSECDHMIQCFFVCANFISSVETFSQTNVWTNNQNLL